MPRARLLAAFSLLLFWLLSCPDRREPVVGAAGKPAPSPAPRQESAPGPSPSPSPAGSAEATKGEPSIRVGLSQEAAIVTVASDGPLVVTSADGKELLRAADLERIEITVDGVAAAPVFLVQLASLETRAAASEAQGRARALARGEATSARATVDPDPDTGLYTIRMGPIVDRDAADRLAIAAKSAGWDGAFVVPGPVPEASAGSLRLRAGGREAVRAPRRVSLSPAEGKPISALGGAYDGRIDVFANQSAKLTVVNVLPLETYLRGVVPNEMGPEQYPKLEALKAQAVAARTYAMRNLGQYETSGFDICATPKCQVYKGVETHHALSDRAVAETRGQIETYDGEPIRALFTATCAGMTENVEAIFHGRGAPYLTSVPCAAEADGGKDLRAVARSERLYAEDGDLVNDELCLARLAGLSVPDKPVRAWIDQKVTRSELDEWIATARDLTGRDGHPVPGPPRELLTRESLVASISLGLGLSERAAILLDASEEAAALAIASDGASVKDRRAWAYLLRERCMLPFADGTLRPLQHPSRGTALRAIARLLGILGHPKLEKATYQSYEKPRLSLEIAGSLAKVELLAGAALFRDVRGEAVPVAELPLTGGDTIVVHRSAVGIDYMKGIDLGKGSAYDRFSKYAEWEVTYETGELETKIAAKSPLKGLTDVQIVSRTASGRVTELLVKATSGDVRLTGLDIRFSLGLRENIFDVERERDRTGIKRFRFVGRGFGHGVGLCQVGGYGMALAGKTYEQILAHYYRGASLERAY
ncbi:MAG: SpoIID/LytB domain-containing protein [Acidobacteriota bacterium]